MFLTTYTVVACTPTIPTLPILVDGLNQTRDPWTFVKLIRQTFQDLAV